MKTKSLLPKSPDFENYKSFDSDGETMPINYIETCFYEDLEKKDIQWMIFGDVAFPKGEFEYGFCEFFWNAPCIEGIEYFREYSSKFKAIRYAEFGDRYFRPKPVKQMKPRAYIKQLILKLKKDCYNAVFDIHMLGGSKSEVRAVKVAYKRAVDELNGFIDVR